MNGKSKPVLEKWPEGIIVNGLRSSEIEKWYGLRVQLSDEISKRLVEEPKGDALDAVLCSVQGGWACLQRVDNWQVPEAYKMIEGWIMDPLVAKESNM